MEMKLLLDLQMLCNITMLFTTVYFIRYKIVASQEVYKNIIIKYRLHFVSYLFFIFEYIF